MSARPPLLSTPAAQDRALFAAVFVVVLSLLWLALPSAGLTDDDDFYAPAARSYAGYITGVLSSPSTIVDRATIDRAFNPNHEHPPFAKLVMGLTQHVTTGLGLFGELDGARAGTALLAALLAAVLALLVRRPLGLEVALAAPVVLFSLPRFFFHSQVATLDVPVASMVVLTTAFFFWGETRPRVAWACGVVFGLAMATKLNAPFAVFPALLYVLVGRRRAFSVDRLSLGLPPVPRALVAMALIGPVVFLAIWPWMWFDTVKRLGAYFGFHLGHYPILNFYDGEIWTKPHAPWHFAFTMAAAAMPPPVIVAGLLGVARGVVALRELWRGAAVDDGLPAVDAATRLRALLVLQTAFAIGIVAFLPVPKYGGEKLFMPFFALFAAHAADGARLVGQAITTLAPRVPRALAVVVVVVIAAQPGWRGIAAHDGGFALSYFSSSVGGIRGAVARGHERTYYDIADKELARWLDANAPGARVHFAPNHKEYARTYRWLQKDGVISRRLVLEKDRARADVVVLTHERRWSTYPGLKAELAGAPVLYEKRIDGVPLYTVYRVAK